MTPLALRLAAIAEVAHETLSFRFDLNGNKLPNQSKVERALFTLGLVPQEVHGSQLPAPIRVLRYSRLAVLFESVDLLQHRVGHGFRTCIHVKPE